MPIASGAFMILRDALSNGVYNASVHRARPDEVKRVTPKEQARFEAWVSQFQPPVCERSEPSDGYGTTGAGRREHNQTGIFFPDKASHTTELRANAIRCGQSPAQRRGVFRLAVLRPGAAQTPA